jgi:hypothetical protein
LRSEALTLQESTKMTTIDQHRHRNARHSLSERTVEILLVVGIVATTSAWITFLGWAGFAVSGIFR